MKPEESQAYKYLESVMKEYADDIVVRGILNYAFKRAAAPDHAIERDGIPPKLLEYVKRGVDIFVDDKNIQASCKTRLEKLAGKKPAPGPGGSPPGRGREPLTRAAAPPGRGESPGRGVAPLGGGRAPLGGAPAAGGGAMPSFQAPRAPAPAHPAGAEVDTVNIDDETGIVTARNNARIIADSLGFHKTDQIKIATAVSELARNIFKYAGVGRIELSRLQGDRPGIRIVAVDKGKGIDNLDTILSGKYRSKTGLGLGLLGCRKLMDEFDIRSQKGIGTTIVAVKYAA